MQIYQSRIALGNTRNWSPVKYTPANCHRKAWNSDYINLPLNNTLLVIFNDNCSKSCPLQMVETKHVKTLISAYVSKCFWNRLFQTFFPQQQRDGIFTAQPPSSQGKETCQKSHASATRQWCCVVFVGVWKQSSGWNSWDIWGFSKCSSANKNRLLCHLGWLTSKITTIPLKTFEVGKWSHFSSTTVPG